MREGLFIISRGIGQVMFQNNALSGALMLVGILCGSWQMALLAVAGNLVGNLTACLCKYSREDIRNGLYGFNGTLVGIAIGVFMPINLLSIALLIAGSALSTWIARLFGYWGKLPGYTAPFILSVWILLAGCTYGYPSLLSASAPAVAEQSPDLIRAFCLNIGQVMFQGNTILSGLFFLAAILVNSRWHALYTVWGALLPILVAWVAGTDYTALNAGLIGYNGVLCAIALGGDTWKSGLWATASILLSIALQLLGMHFGFVTLTAPFVVAVWIILKGGLSKLSWSRA